MSEFKIQVLTRDLIKAVESTESPETYVEALQQSKLKYSSSQNVATQSCLKRLTENSPRPQQFIDHYNELKERNIDYLNPYIHLLSLIAEDKKLKGYLEKNSKRSQESKVAESMTPSEVPDVVNKLKEVARLSCDSREKRKRHHTPHQNLREPLWPIPSSYMSLDFRPDLLAEPFPPTRSAIPLCSQERVLVENLLYLLAGVGTEYIAPIPLSGKYAKQTFTVSPLVDPVFQEGIRNILPVVSHYSMVVRFIEERRNFEFGQVNHALVAAMGTLLTDYLSFINQMEDFSQRGDLSLTKLHFYLQPMFHSMEILAKIASAVCKSNAKGGKVLSLLHEHTAQYMGIPKSRELCLYLTQLACKPYMEMLEKWLYKGMIYDPYHEFLVEDHEVVQLKEETEPTYSHDYWEKRYRISRERVPVFLERMAWMILRTGKYLNVLQQCGKNLKAPKVEPLEYTITERQYVEVIEKAYTFASKTLLELILEENDLMGRLRSVKHYFLLDQGDFIVQFMDSCESELCKNIDDLVPTRLESLLELALRTSAANQDPYKEDMCMSLLPFDLISQMSKILKIDTSEEKIYQRMHCEKKDLTGLRAFTFNYNVKWPVSLVLHREGLARYQMIFRHLFYCKHVERLLCRVWLKNKLAKRFSLKASQMYVAAFALRQRMLNCVQNLEYYTMVEVIEPNWVLFISKMNKVHNIDDVITCHSDFLDSCLKDSMLTNPDLLENVYYLLDICMEFYEFIQHMGRYFIDAELTSMLGSGYESSDSYGEAHEPGDKVLTQRSKRSEPSAGRSYVRKRIISEIDTFEEAVAKLDTNFTSTLVKLMEKIMSFQSDNNNDKLVNLVYRLDFNNFYNMTGCKESCGRTGEETSG